MVKIQIECNGVCREVEVKAEMVIGRRTGCDIRLEDPSVSGRHVRIRPVDGGAIHFEDIGSSNGTYLDSHRQQAGTCRPGMDLKIGGSILRILEIAEKDRGAADPDYELLQAKPLDEPLKLESAFDRILFRVALSLSAAPESAAFYGVVLDIVMEHFPFLTSCGIVMGLDKKCPDLAAHRARLGGKPPTVSQTVIRRVRDGRIAVLMRDAREEAMKGGGKNDLGQSLIYSDVQSLLAAPILRSGRVTGLFQMEAPALPFSDRDLQCAMALGNIIGAVIDGEEARKKTREAERGKAILERYLSRDVVDRLMKSEDSLKLGGDLRDVTVFFSDIRGYTALAEKLPPNELVGMLNHFFGQMVRKIFEHNGMIDKFIGDAVMAVFGAPYPAVDDARRACRTAIAIREDVRRLSMELRQKTGILVEMGYGLASGPVISGNIGWERRMEYTSIGDAVNLSSRLVGIAGPGEILIDEETKKRAGEVEVRSRGEMQVKGKSKPVHVYELLSAPVS